MSALHTRLQGSPAITAWCHVCEYRTVPILDGICGFCDTPIAGFALERAAGVRAERARIRARDRRRRAALARPAPPTPTKELIVRALRERGPLTTPELSEILGRKPNTISAQLSVLRAHDAITAVGEVYTGARPAVRWELSS